MVLKYETILMLLEQMDVLLTVSLLNQAMNASMQGYPELKFVEMQQILELTNVTMVILFLMMAAVILVHQNQTNSLAQPSLFQQLVLKFAEMAPTMEITNETTVILLMEMDALPLVQQKLGFAAIKKDEKISEVTDYKEEVPMLEMMEMLFGEMVEITTEQSKLDLHVVELFQPHVLKTVMEQITISYHVRMEMPQLEMDEIHVQLRLVINATKEILLMQMFVKKYVETVLITIITIVTMETTILVMVVAFFVFLKQAMNVLEETIRLLIHDLKYVAMV